MVFWLMALSYKLSWDLEGFFGDLLWEMPNQVGHDGKKGGGNDGAMNGQHKTVLFRAGEGIFSMGQHEKGHFCADQLSVLTHKIS